MKKIKKAPDDTRQLLLDAAQIVFCRSGYSATKLEDIAKEAGLTRGAISWHFKNKLSLYKTLILETYKAGMQQVFCIMESSLPTAVKVEMLIDFYMDDRESKSVQTTLYNNLLYERTQGIEGLIEKIDGLFENLFKHHSAMLRKGVEAGDIAPEVDPDTATRLFYSCLWGFFLKSNFHENLDDSMIRKHIKTMLIPAKK